MAPSKPSNPSPEEQLLRLIETGGEGPSAKVANGSLRPLDPNWWKQWWGRFLEDFKEAALAAKAAPRWSLKTINLQLLNKMLAGVLALVVLYMLWDIASPKRSIKDVYAQAEALPIVQPAREVVTPLEPLEQYTAVLQQRDVFRMGPAPTVAAPGPVETLPPAPTVSAAKATLDDTLQTLRVVGIAWGPSPEVMVEDTQAGRTYFLQRGQTVKQLTVQQIFRDKVVFAYAGEQGELVAP